LADRLRVVSLISSSDLALKQKYAEFHDFIMAKVSFIVQEILSSLPLQGIIRTKVDSPYTDWQPSSAGCYSIPDRSHRISIQPVDAMDSKSISEFKLWGHISCLGPQGASRRNPPQYPGCNSTTINMPARRPACSSTHTLVRVRRCNPLVTRSVSQFFGESLTGY
jgi:hypothetical protein